MGCDRYARVVWYGCARRAKTRVACATFRRARVIGGGVFHVTRARPCFLFLRVSQALGIAAASLDCAVQYSMERKAFGQPIGGLYAIQVHDVRFKHSSVR